MPWNKYEECTYHTPGIVPEVVEGQLKIACFDFDNTLIISDRGEPYATKGFMLAYANILEVLRRLYTEGFTIVIFSNRSGPPYMLSAAQRRITEIEAALSIPLHCFFATSRRKDEAYRKPKTGMMALFASLHGMTTYGPDSFYSGDAVGFSSTNPWFRWSADDSNFAKACGLPFKSPDEIFASFPPANIPPNIRLVITIGQHGSGVETNLPCAGQIVPFTSTSRLVILTDAHIANPEMIPQVEADVIPIYYVIGSHPTHTQREHIRQVLGIDSTAVAYHLYARPSYDKALSDLYYTKTLQLPTAYTRCN